MPHLIVIYGPPLSGKTSLAREVASALEDKSAVVSVDALADEAILAHDTDSEAEMEMVSTQARLLVANYLKNRYHVVLEGAFYYPREDRLIRREQEIDQVLALMRNIAHSPMLVRLSIEPDTLRRRIEESRRAVDIDLAMRINAAYKQREDDHALILQVDGRSTIELAGRIMEHPALT